MLSIVTMPSASDIIGNTTSTGITQYSLSLFGDFLPIIWIGVGVVVAVLAVKYVRGVMKGGAKRLFRRK